MRFLVTSGAVAGSVVGPVVFLVTDDWNDWYTWVTMFTAIAFDAEGNRSILGSVKIGKKGMTKENARTEIPDQFEQLNEDYFSLGQDENYYETLNTLGEEFRVGVLAGLRDCASDLAIFAANRSELVMTEALLRSVPPASVERRLSRLASGNAALTRYSFRFDLAPDPRTDEGPLQLDFVVRPESLPPTNVHVLIGRNGVGKTRCFDYLMRTLLGMQGPKGVPTGALVATNTDPSALPFSPVEPSIGFAGLVTVSFSAFDAIEPLGKNDGATAGIRYAYIGLKKVQSADPAPAAQIDSEDAASHDEAAAPLKTRIELRREFVESVGACRVGLRLRRWREALITLEADPLFKEADVSSLANADEHTWRVKAARLFRDLSSGHGIVLLTVTRLVELVDERSLVLLDEPEGHLHPPLLSAFIRALSDLLTQRNGVAIVATHSPVVLQEVPRSCAWILGRSGLSARADRPEMETFGENVGVLTREVFGLEVTQSGFHRMVAQAVETEVDYDAVLSKFGERLGGEARALARALTIAPRDDPAGAVALERE